MGKQTVCPRCKGRGKIGRDLCRACNPSAAVGDRVAGAGQRLLDRLAGNKVEITPVGVVETRRGRQTVTRLPDGVAPPGSQGNPHGCDRCGKVATLTLTRRGAHCSDCR